MSGLARVLAAHCATRGVAFFDAGTGDVFTGDLYVSGGATAILIWGDPWQEAASLRRIAALNPRRALTGHGEIIRDPAAKFRLKAERIDLAPEFFDTYLDSGKAVILLDGLDEVAELTDKLMKAGDVKIDPLLDPVSAVSCGIYAGQPVLDLDYPEDSEAGVDGNFIMTGSGKLIEVQMSAETRTGWKTLHLAVASITGSAPDAPFVLVGGHLDAWYHGGTDNAGANVAMLELTRAFWRHRDRLR